MSSPRRLPRFTSPLLGVTLVALIAWACSKNPTTPTLVVASNTTLPANATLYQAVNGTTFNFPAGAGVLSPTVAGQNLALTLNGTGTTTTTVGTVTTATGATTGTFTAATTFGSCIFAITSSTFAAGSAFAVGQVITVSPCNMTVSTAGAVANGVSTTRSVALVLGAASSANASVTVAVNASGGLTLNGTIVGTVTLTPVSG